MNFKKISFKQWMILFCFLISSFLVFSQVNTGGNYNTSHHNKEIIGYITQWDAWKSSSAGVPSAGALTHLNIDYSKYTILNFSFFGVAVDGSLHSGDFRNKQIYQPGTVQDPADIFYTDIYSSWDLHILFGEIEPIQYINEAIAERCRQQGFEVEVGGSTWSHPTWGISGSLPVPLHKEDGAPGLLELAHQNGVKVMASIGGWSMCRHFPEMAADPVKRQRFIDDCVKLINIGFDGIDLDWEYPGPYAGMNFTGTQADFANFTQLVEEIRSAIGPDKLITAAFSANPTKIEGFQWDQLANLMDYFNFMTYDFNGGWSNKAGINAPLNEYDGAEEPTLNHQSTYQKLVDLGVPSQKINFGLPFYGRGVICNGNADLNQPTVKRQETVQPDGPITTCADFTNWPRDVYDGTPNYFYIKQKALGAGSGWTRHWNDQAKVPYLTKNQYFLSYDDEESIAHKAQFIVDHQLAGTIIWTVYGDLEISGTATSFGSKLKRWSDVKSPLINKVNEIFANGNSNLAPQVSITSPQNNATFTEGTNITITADAIDTDGVITQVEFFVGSSSIGVSSTFPYSIVWTNATAGTYALKAVATDDGGAMTTSATVTIIVQGTGDNLPPTVSITDPADGSSFDKNSNILIQATAEDSDGTVVNVDFYQGSTLLGSDDTAPYSMTWNNVAVGSYSISAVATDNEGATGTSALIAITVVD
ncbi:MAG: glycosyl hydrolase family 18 protein, partial [Spirochaetes bacterium]|nr:glycosyl hydrolase family 18 protein [Spirochaetota bacterium]